MRSLLLGCASAAAVFIATALAQPPQEIVATDTIELRSEQTKAFTFDHAVAKISLSDRGVAEVTPDNDKAFYIRGMKPGHVLMTAYAPDGSIVYRANIVVDIPPLGYVRIYGLKSKNEIGQVFQNQDYVSYYCTSTGCSRANPDIEQPPERSGSVSKTSPTSDGGSVTRTYDYR